MNARIQRLFDGPAVTRGMTWRQFIAIVCLFWIYVTLSNVLYTYGLRVGISKFTPVMVFSPSKIRVLQHLILLPLLLATYWASLVVDWRPLWRGLIVQVLLGAMFAATAYPAIAIAQYLCDDTMNDPSHMMNADQHLWDPALPSLWFASFISFLISYFFGLALLRGAVLYKRTHDAELQVASLEREAHAARLSALRMQLSPHTLFNLLHTIRGNIEWDPRGAQAMVVQLADLLRRLLNAGERNYSRLGDELQFAELYLKLHQRRFEDRITVVLPDPGGLPSVWVPSLILQPLVENAIVHGLAGHQGPITITVGAGIAGDALELTVTNTVAPQSVRGRDGIGLKNVRERLAIQFGADASLECRRDHDLWCVRIRMPTISAVDSA